MLCSVDEYVELKSELVYIIRKPKLRLLLRPILKSCSRNEMNFKGWSSVIRFGQFDLPCLSLPAVLLLHFDVSFTFRFGQGLM